MKRTLTQWLPLLALVISASLGSLPAAAEQPASDNRDERPSAAQTAADQAADAAEEAADKAVESLNQETKLDLDFALEDHHIESVAAR